MLGSSRGGIRRHVRYLAQNPPPGYETLGVWGPSDLSSYFTDVPFHTVGVTHRLLPPRDADVVHAHGYGAALCALSPLRPPVVVTAHIDLHTQGRTARSRPLRAVAHLAAARADSVIGVSAATARAFRGAHVIPPAFDPLPPPARSRSEVRYELGTADDRVVVATVARLHPDKGLDLLVDTLDGTAAEGWICGDGPLRAELERRARDGCVRLLGYRTDVSDILAAADVFALPSVGEAYGIAVVEAISAGLPVVVSAAGAMPEIAGDAGLVVAPGDRAAFREALRRVVSDAALRSELASRAHARGSPDNTELVRMVGLVYDEVTR